MEFTLCVVVEVMGQEYLECPLGVRGVRGIRGELGEVDTGSYYLKGVQDLDPGLDPLL